MKVLKALGATVLILLCTALLAFSGFFLWSSIPRADRQPERLDTEDIFLEETPTDPLPPADDAEEPAPEQTPEEEEVPEQQPEEEEPPEEEPEPLTPAQAAAAYLQTMTPEERIWQLFFVTPESLTEHELVTRAGETTQEFIQSRPVGGLIYFADNLIDREQVQALLGNVQTYSKTPLFLGVDEEGGVVSRAGSNDALGVTHFEPAEEYGLRGNAEEVYYVGRVMALELGQLGFNLNFAPVADVITNENNTEIGSRAYSSDPNVAAPLVSAMVQGMQEAGMAACLKHFPGHGSTETDSHEGKSVSTRTLEELQQTEWIPFQAGIDQGAAFVMVGHQTNENLSPMPASLSPAVMAYLRNALNFDGIIITDSMQMGAILNEYTSAEAAVLALQAGADMLLMPNDLQTAYDGVLAAVADGTLTQARIDESVLRILTAKYAFGILE